MGNQGRRVMIWRCWIRRATDRPGHFGFPGDGASMTKRRARQLLWLTAATAGGGAVLVISLAAALPLDLPTNGAAPPALSGTEKTSPADGIPSLPELEKVSSIDLGHELVASAPQSSAALLPQTAAPELHVIGTILEPGHCMAMLIG